ncbi:MAG: hypothetical protein ACE5GE_07935 [Phycisphaerae bacterium]
MGGVLAGLNALGGALVVLQLDINGFLYSNEFVALIAGLVTALLSGIANALIGNSFATPV